MPSMWRWICPRPSASSTRPPVVFNAKNLSGVTFHEFFCTFHEILIYVKCMFTNLLALIFEVLDVFVNSFFCEFNIFRQKSVLACPIKFAHDVIEIRPPIFCICQCNKVSWGAVSLWDMIIDPWLEFICLWSANIHLILWLIEKSISISTQSWNLHSLSVLWGPQESGY